MDRLPQKSCLHCSKIFFKTPNISLKTWNIKSKFCSHECYWVWKIGKYRGENGPNWRGNKIQYWGLHDWIRSKKGKPQKCELCGTTKKRQYDWANKTGEYKRVLSDWMRVCVPCHRKHDYENGIIKPEGLKR